MATADFLKFEQFTKVEEDKSGSVIVWGIATEQKPDLDNEVSDYDTAKAVYKAWSEAQAKRTKNAGQDISLGNIRLQHGLPIGGKATKIEFDDDDKAIYLGSVPLTDEIRDDLRAGFYTGYSQGGSYAWRKCSDCGKSLTLAQASNWCPDCKRNVTVLYGLKRLSEVSYVDSPASGVGFEYVKSNGSREIVKFAKRGAEEMPELTPAQVEQVTVAVRKKETAIRKKARQAFMDAITKAAEAKGLQKDLYSVGELARILQGLAYMYENSVYERDMEEDESEVPEELKAILDSAVETFIRMAEEEARELASRTDKTSKLNKGGSMTPEETAAAETAAKAAQAAELAKKKGMAHHFAKTAAHHEKMAGHHEKMAAHHETMHAACKADVESQEAPEHTGVANAPYYKAAGAHHKAMASVHEKCGKCHMAAAEHNHGMAESHDAEEHAKVSKAIKDADAVEAANAPAPIIKAAVPTMDAEIAAEMEKERNSPEHKQRISEIAKSLVEKEVEEKRQALRAETIAPDGVKLAATGTEGAGIRVVQRGGGEAPFKFAPADKASSSTGL